VQHSNISSRPYTPAGTFRGRRFIGLLATTVAVSVMVACGSDSNNGTGPNDPDVTGSWTLQTIDGKAPPDTVIDEDTLVVEFLDGTLTLNSDMSYRLLFHSRTTHSGVPVADTSGSTGTYTQSGNSVTIHNGANDGTVVATVDLPNLTFTDNDEQFVFTKGP
jgi:hypothetical protein